MSSTLYAYLYGDSAKQSQITKHLTTEQSLSHFSYDVNGRLSNQVEDGTNLPKSFVYNAAGELLQRSTTASTKHFFYADGQRIGDVGNAPDENPRISYAEQLVRNWGGDTPEARRTRYSNPMVDNLLTASLQNLDDKQRDALVGRAIKVAMDDQALIPVFHPIFDFASKKGLVITPRPQRRFNALMVAPAAK